MCEAHFFPRLVPNAIPGFDCIPTDVVGLIFSYFAIKESYRVQTVCKQWFTHLWSSIRTLECSDSRAPAERQKEFRPPVFVTSLTSLGLPYYSQNPTMLVECIKRNTSLTRLDIYGCDKLHISNITSALPMVTNLTSLNFSVSQIQDTVVECVAANLSNLKKFAFARCFHVTKDSVAHLTSLTKLTDLWLSEVIDDWGILKNHLTQLTKLVSNNQRVVKLFSPATFFEAIDAIVEMNPPSVGPDVRLWINYSQRDTLRQLQAVPGNVLYLGNAIAPIQRYCWDKAGTESKLILDYLIDKKTDINIQSEGHATPLMIASCVGNEEIVRTLLRANAKPNVPDRKAKRTPVMNAIALGHVNVATILMAHPDVKVQMYDKLGQTPLHLACNSSAEMFKAVFSCQTAEPPKKLEINARDSKGCTPIFMACRKGDLSIVSTLISADADINAKNEYGITPLWELFNNVVFDDSAAHITAIIDYLDQNGITIKLADIVHAESGVSLLQLAVRAGHESAVERIMKVVSEQELNRDGKDCRAAILECTKLPSAEVMRVILQQVLARGLKLNTSLSRLAMLNHSPGLIIATPLLWAIRMYDYETVELLLKCGADPNYTGSDPSARPDYPIVLALSTFKSELVQLLISYGASLSVTQYHGANLLMLATVTNSELVVILYTANPSLAKAMDERGASVLHYAALVANPETIRFLLDTEAKELLNVLNSEGESALYVACAELANSEEHFSDISQSVRILLAAGASPMANPKKTPVQLVHSNVKAYELVEQLVDAGDSVFFTTPFGETILHSARTVSLVDRVIASLSASPEVDKEKFVNTQREDGATALFVACDEQKDPAIIRTLLDNGANPNLSNMDGRTPLHVAAAIGNKLLVELLLNSPTIDVTKTNKLGLDASAVATPECRAMIFANAEQQGNLISPPSSNNNNNSAVPPRRVTRSSARNDSTPK